MSRRIAIFGGNSATVISIFDVIAVGGSRVLLMRFLNVINRTFSFLKEKGKVVRI